MMKAQANTLQRDAIFMNSLTEMKKQEKMRIFKTRDLAFILNKVKELAQPLHFSKRCF